MRITEGGIIIAMKKLFLIAITSNLLVWALAVQRGGPPRRIENPKTIDLAGGARVEFKSFTSPALGKEAHYSIYFPPSYSSDQSSRFPVVYFLHGMWNDHTSWTVERYGGIPQRIESLMVSKKLPEFVMVHPAGENSFYTDYLDESMNFETFVVKDLVAVVEKNYRVADTRAARSIGGVSMGAYGALKIALKYPEQYAAVAGISPIVFTGEDPSRYIMDSDSRFAQYFKSALKPVYGMPFDSAHWKENSLEALAHTSNPQGMKIFFAYGTADRYNDAFPMEAGVRTFAKILDGRGIPHEFRVYQDGPHGWRLVVDHLEEVAESLTQTF